MTSSNVHRVLAPVPDSLRGVAVFTMFRGDAQQLAQWCNFHLAVGADRLYVVLDRPDPALLAALPEDSRIQWQSVEEGDWAASYADGGHHVERRQVDAFRWAARRAAADGCAFLAFVDADELILLRRPFATIAQEHPQAAALSLPVREMWFDAGDDVTDAFGATLALRRSSLRGRRLLDAFGWRSQFLRAGLLGHAAGKTVYRLPLEPGELTVHRPRSGAMAAARVDVPGESGVLLHYDAGNLEAWNAKWASRLTGGTVAVGLGSHRSAQQTLFAGQLARPAPEQAEFFREFYSLPESSQSVLGEAGVLERAEVREAFSGPVELSAASRPDPIRTVAPLSRRVDYQFALVCDGRFVKPTFATMASVLAQVGHRGSIRFVVLGDGLSDHDILHLRSLEHTAYDVEVVVHDVTADLDRDIGIEDAKRATFGRVYLIDYLPPQRTVYLDGDVLATRDFTELFSMDLGGACLAGVPDSAALRLLAEPTGVPLPQRNRILGITDGEPLDYLNGGVLVFDLDNPDFRRLALETRRLVVLLGRALTQRDQDAMNLAFAGSKLRLPSTYNYMTQFYVSERAVDGDLPQLKYAAADAALIHFSGKIKPWEAPEEEFYNGLYRRLVREAERVVGVSCEFYFSQTPPAPRRRLDASRWQETLTAQPHAVIAEEPVDLAVVEATPERLYLRTTAAAYQLVTRRRLHLIGVVGDRVVLTADLADLSAPLPQVAASGGGAVRWVGVRGDTPEAAVEILLVEKPDLPTTGFVRSLGTVVLAPVPTTPAHRSDGQVVGGIEGLDSGLLLGWAAAHGSALGEPVSLWVDGELAALSRASFDHDDVGGVRAQGFALPLARTMGEMRGPIEAAVRIRGASGALRPDVVAIANLERSHHVDLATGQWRVTRRRPVRAIARRMRSGVNRATDRLRAK